MKIFKRIILVIFTACFILSANGCGLLAKVIGLLYSPSFENRVYERIDENAAFSLVNEIKILCANNGSYEELNEKRNSLFLNYYTKASTLYTLATINYDLDVTNEYWEQECVWATNFYQKIHNAVLEAEKAIFTSSHADKYIEVYGQDYADSLLATTTFTEDQLNVLAQINTLEASYSSLAGGTFTDEQMTEILADLVIARNSLAKTIKDENGEYYDNYLEYSYANEFSREYTPNDAQTFINAIKTHVLPVYQVFSSESTPGLYNKNVATKADDYLKLIPEIVRNTFSDMITSWDYMVSHNLYNFDALPNKANTSYVIDFNEYSDAFMFINPRGNFISDISTILHEFGHYNEVFMADSSLSSSGAFNYELAETHSQAFELITLPAVHDVCTKYYEEGEELYRSYSMSMLSNSFWSLLSGSAITAFELYIYTAEEEQLTSDNLTQKFTQFFNDYWPDGTSYQFYDIPHIYTSPAYYISYPVSMIFSNVVWASKNPVETYAQVVKYGASNHLFNVCLELSLPNPLLEETIISVTNNLKAYASETFNFIFHF